MSCLQISSNIGISDPSSRIPLTKGKVVAYCPLDPKREYITRFSLLYSSVLLDTCPIQLKNSSAMAAAAAWLMEKEHRNARSLWLCLVPTCLPDLNKNLVKLPASHCTRNASGCP
jgi:hypothetical protein